MSNGGVYKGYPYFLRPIDAYINGMSLYCQLFRSNRFELFDNRPSGGANQPRGKKALEGAAKPGLGKHSNLSLARAKDSKDTDGRMYSLGSIRAQRTGRFLTHFPGLPERPQGLRDGWFETGVLFHPQSLGVLNIVRTLLEF